MISSGVTTSKTCNRCGISKLSVEFYKNSSSKDGLQGHCKLCHKEYMTDYRRDNREYYLEYVRAYRKRNPDRTLDSQVRKYGITGADYKSMLTEQGGICANSSCTNAESKTGYRLDVDHCHKTGRVRGLLCRDCNLILGHSNDDPEILRGLAIYLEEG